LTAEAGTRSSAEGVDIAEKRRDLGEGRIRIRRQTDAQSQRMRLVIRVAVEPTSTWTVQPSARPLGRPRGSVRARHHQVAVEESVAVLARDFTTGGPIDTFGTK